MSLKEENISKWYESVIYNSGIASPGLVKGTLFIHPRGWSIWEKIREFIDNEFQAKGIKNVAFPALIPLSEIEKEKAKLSGFIPELYLVSKSSDSSPATVFLRPTSEILFSYFFRKFLNSYEQLPFLFNQWCNVYRAEKNTKAFLRTCEFYWQEAHTLHLREEDAYEYLDVFHSIYQDLAKNLLNIAVLAGEKTVNERFQGAEKTLTLEAIMPDGQALQIATSHYLGQNFSKMFEIEYTNKENERVNPYQLSAGTSTRLLGALILSHSDDLGLVLPIDLAESKVKILVLENVIVKDSSEYQEISEKLKDYGVSWDFSNKSFGYKIKSEELIGTPFSIVIGNKEKSSNSFLVKSRRGLKKICSGLEELKEYLEEQINRYNKDLYLESEENLKSSIVEASSLEEVKREVLENRKIVLVPWFDNEENETKFKEEKLGFGPRCIKSRIKDSSVKCFYSGKLANSYVYFGRSY